MSTWDGKSKGTSLGYRIFVMVLSWFGIVPAYFLLIFVAFYYLIFSRESNKAIYYLLRQRLKFSLLKSIIGIYKNYYYFGQSMIDRVAGYHHFKFIREGEHYLTDLMAEKKGAILISAHVGNWEIAGRLLDLIDTRINIVMFDNEDPKIKQYLEKIKDFNVNVIFIKKDGVSHVFEINEALNRNELVCIHGDRFMPGTQVTKMNFLGEEANFPTGPFLLGVKFQVPISFVFATKDNNHTYHFSATKPKIYIPSTDRANRSNEINNILGDFTSTLESVVRKYPYQWFNYYEFWKN